MNFPLRPDRKLPHVIARVRFQQDPTPLACSCGWATAIPWDHAFRDRHQRLYDAWLGHRKDVGAPAAWSGGRSKERDDG